MLAYVMWSTGRLPKSILQSFHRLILWSIKTPPVLSQIVSVGTFRRCPIICGMCRNNKGLRRNNLTNKLFPSVRLRDDVNSVFVVPAQEELLCSCRLSRFFSLWQSNRATHSLKKVEMSSKKTLMKRRCNGVRKLYFEIYQPNKKDEFFRHVKIPLRAFNAKASQERYKNSHKLTGSWEATFFAFGAEN